MNRHLLSALFVTVLAPLAEAQENPCVDLARIIGMNSQSSLSQDQQQEVRKADFCREEYSFASNEMKAHLEAAYELYSGKLSASHEEITEAQTKECNSQFGAFWRNQLKTDEARTVSIEGAETIKSCFDLYRSNLAPKITIVDFGKEITLSMQFLSGVAGNIGIEQFGPADLKNNECLCNGT